MVKKSKKDPEKEKLKEKFSRIFKKGVSKPRDVFKLNKIYETIKNSKKPLRIREISETINIKINTVRDYIKKYLEAKLYVKKSRVYTPPYLMVEPYGSDPEFVYGKDNKNSRIEDEVGILLKNSFGLGNLFSQQLKFIKNNKIYNSRFFKVYNELVEELWSKSITKVSKMRIGSGANRYTI